LLFQILNLYRYSAADRLAEAHALLVAPLTASAEVTAAVAALGQPRGGALHVESS
jgi:hypothetical protein